MEPVAQLIRNESHPVIGYRIPLITEFAKMRWELLNPGSWESKSLPGMAEYYPSSNIKRDATKRVDMRHFVAYTLSIVMIRPNQWPTPTQPPSGVPK